MLNPIKKMNKKMKNPSTWVNIVDTFVGAKIQQKLNYRKRDKSFLMSLRKFLTFSSIICALFFIYLGSFGTDSSFWQRVFILLGQMVDQPGEGELDWPKGFNILGFMLLIGNVALYFLAKNWKRSLYLGIFVGLLVLSLLVSTWILTK